MGSDPSLREAITSKEFYRLASLVGCEPEDEERHRKQLSDYVAQLLDRATVEAQANAYQYARAAVIASPVCVSGQHIGNLPGGMPHVMDRQVGTEGPNELPVYATTYSMRDFILAKLDEQVATLKAGTPEEHK